MDRYVGARYMPKFVGTHDLTTNYEALSVVDNGMGTSYVANQPVPAGTPLTDTTYWAVYGSTNGAIINLQNQINDLHDEVDIIVNKFDNVAAMVNSADLAIGNVVMTKGYYTSNDGGGAWYIIVDTKTSGHFYEDLDNGLYAEMVVSETVSIMQLGATTLTDIKPYIEKYLAGIDQQRIELYIPSGEWICSPTLINKSNAHIRGDSSFTNRSTPTTLIKAASSQSYIWKMGKVADMTSSTLDFDDCVMSASITGITFASDDLIAYGALVLEYCTYSIFEKINFIGLVGTGLYVRSCWENRFYDFMIRAKTDFTKPAVLFADVRPVDGAFGNISSNIFDHFIIEYLAGDIFKFEHGAGFVNNYFGAITIEWTTATLTTDTEVSADPSAVETHIFNGNPRNTYIECLVVAGLDTKYYLTSGGLVYHQGSFINFAANVGSAEPDIVTLTVGSINVRQPHTIVTGKNVFEAGELNIGVINLESNVASIDDLFNVDSIFPNIEIGTVCSRNHFDKTIGEPLYRLGYNVYSDSGAQNDKRLVLKQVTGTWLVNNAIAYPFDASAEHHVLFRVKGNTGEQFSLRYVLNGANQTKIATLTADGWQLVDLAITADFNSKLGILYASTNMLFDTIQYVY